ncbi:MAG: DUF502 domain-containing protein [Chitinophagaceae bacterium]|nr:DUF502 domain-containing protein [Chitinophagaceae bacterium]
MNVEDEPDLKWHWRKMFQYFLQGLIILAPITITVWAVISLFIFIDNILPNFINFIFPDFANAGTTGEVKKIPGLGFLIVIVLVIVVGWISSSFIVGKIVDLLDHVLERTPGIKFLYTSLKDFIKAFAGNKKKFDKPVLVNVDGPDVWRMGFMTQRDCHSFGLQDHAVVYVPHSYALSGIVYIVPINKVKILDHTTSADAMKFAVSGGVSDVHE